jgi:hypothetical protein
MNKPRILFYDLETAPVKAWIWRTGEQYVNHSMIVEGERFEIITIAWKWLGEKKVHCLDWGKDQNSAKMLDIFVKELESADVVIGQNNLSFDDKHLNIQRLLHNQAPIAWPTSEDMRRQIKRHFYVTSSSLEYMAKLLTGDGKDKMHFQDWVDIITDNCPKALAKMKKYNKRDVVKTEEVWKKIQGHVQPKAHRGIIMGKGRDSCKSCGSSKLQLDGFKYSATGKVQRVRCKDCGYVGTNR